MSAKSNPIKYWNKKHYCYLPKGQDSPSTDQLTLDSFIENVSQMSHEKDEAM